MSDVAFGRAAAIVLAIVQRERGALALFPILMVVVFGPLLVAFIKLAKRSAA